jgi:hypothetical protein
MLDVNNKQTAANPYWSSEPLKHSLAMHVIPVGSLYSAGGGGMDVQINALNISQFPILLFSFQTQ